MCETERLIDLVKNYPILYNMKNKYYKDINKKATVWKEIAIQLDLEDGESLYRVIIDIATIE